MTHFLYIIGNLSNFDDIELRYSLRSIQKHHKQFSVTIAGWKPKWCAPDRFIPIQEPNQGKAKNTYLKLLEATRQLDSGLYVLMCDDFILLEPHIHKMYYFGTLRERTMQGSFYAKRLFGETLKLTDPKALCFDTHMPFSFDRNRMLAVLERNKRNLGVMGFSYQSLYGNNEPLLAIEQHENAKVGALPKLPYFKAVSLADSVVAGGCDVLERYLPEPSRYEL